MSVLSVLFVLDHDHHLDYDDHLDHDDHLNHDDHLVTEDFHNYDDPGDHDSKKATRLYTHCQRKYCGYPEMAADFFSRLERFCEESQVMAAYWSIAQINNHESLS